MAQSVVEVKGYFESIPGGSKSVNLPNAESSTPPQAETQLILASGFNEITVPALATGCIIIFDTTSAVDKTLKGVTGDTGIALDPNGWHILRFVAGAVASFGITAASADTGLYTTIIWF